MPVVRVSNQLWKEISEVAGEDGVSLSYALDKIIDGLRVEREGLLDQIDETPKILGKEYQNQISKLKEQIEKLKAEPKIIEKVIYKNKEAKVYNLKCPWCEKPVKVTA